MAAGDTVDDAHVIARRPVTIEAAFTAEAPPLMPLPSEPFDPALRLEARVDNRSRCRCGRASTPSPPVTSAVGSRSGSPRARSRSMTARSWSPATNGRSAVTSKVLTLDHYLKVLKVKPGGLPGATALAQARAAKAFTAAPQAYRDASRRLKGDAAGTRALIAGRVDAQTGL